jgi:hypothetical protein
MTTVTLKIDAETKAGKLLFAMIELFSKENKGVKVIQTNKKSGIDEALEDVKNEKTNSYNDSDDLLKSVLKE